MTCESFYLLYLICTSHLVYQQLLNRFTLTHSHLPCISPLHIRYEREITKKGTAAKPMPLLQVSSAITSSAGAAWRPGEAAPVGTS
ncbi:hypothetical protein BX600DRAFT_451041 [Xylariales sp. PMI_506]|nr:hypothetical protein BX600DRAFT_451041 [Xylariales sp. PMI_506]